MWIFMANRKYRKQTYRKPILAHDDRMFTQVDVCLLSCIQIKLQLSLSLSLPLEFYGELLYWQPGRSQNTFIIILSISFPVWISYWYRGITERGAHESTRKWKKHNFFAFSHLFHSSLIRYLINALPTLIKCASIFLCDCVHLYTHIVEEGENIQKPESMVRFINFQWIIHLFIQRTLFSPSPFFFNFIFVCNNMSN